MEPVVDETMQDLVSRYTEAQPDLISRIVEAHFGFDLPWDFRTD